MAIPGGGSVLVAEPYNCKPDYPTYARKHGLNEEMLVGYRNWRSTLSGHPECDGMIAVGRVERFQDLRDFMVMARGGLSIQWSDADRIPGQPWTGDEKRYPVEERTGPLGPEMIQLLAVHRVGWFGVYDDPALMYVVGDRNGLNIAIWITNKHGGAKRALQHVDRIAASFQP